jgi:hypothetical protein
MYVLSPHPQLVKLVSATTPNTTLLAATHCGSYFDHSALIPVRAATARIKGRSFSMRAFTLWLDA